MGCLSSKTDINDTHPNSFVVYNIDDANNKVSEGHLVITDEHLLLYQKGKDVVNWPLKCLRRYGAEGDIFSFESGRKCDTGPGIYAFRCTRAEKMLSRLQEKVRSNTTSSYQATTTTNANRQEEEVPTTNPEVTPPPPPSNPPLPTSAGGNEPLARVLSTTPSVNTVQTELLDPLTMPEYANVTCNGGPITLEAADGYLVPNTPVNLKFTNNICHDQTIRDYENVGLSAENFMISRSPHDIIGKSITISTTLPMTAVGTVATDLTGGLPMLPPKPSPLSAKLSSVPERIFFSNEVVLGSGDVVEPPESPKINYIDVDFDNANPCGVAPSSPTCEVINLKSPPFTMNGLNKESQQELKGQYCTIDIDRTKALCNTAKQQTLRGLDPHGGLDSPEGVRKTRHNSTLSELAGFTTSLVGGKRNSVISE